MLKNHAKILPDAIQNNMNVMDMCFATMEVMNQDAVISNIFMSSQYSHTPKRLGTSFIPKLRAATGARVWEQWHEIT